jgi:uncharacterized protein YjbI with pentapeptide repeats
LDEEQAQAEHGKYSIQQEKLSFGNEEVKEVTNVSAPSFTLSEPINKNPSFAKQFWEWSGFANKTLLEILQFLLIFVPLVTFVADQKDRELTRRENYQNEIKLNQEEVLSEYLDEIKEFMLNDKLNQETVQKVARAETFSVLRRINGEQRGELLRFLYEVKLISHECQIDLRTLETISCQEPILELNGARLDETTFGAKLALRRIELSGASLVNAQLLNCDLAEANMHTADLRGADLSGSLLTDANLRYADLEDAILAETHLIKTDLSGANLRGANLRGANLRGANLRGADLRNADLSEASLENANATQAIYNSATKFPIGFDPIKQGLILDQ